MAVARMFASVGVAAAMFGGLASAAGPKPPPIAWIMGYEAGLAEAKVTGRPILLNFWCGT